MNNMFISICVPVFNVSGYIERCARSIFEQTYSDWEAIFVDDCSPDDSIERLESVLCEYPVVKDKVKIVHHEKNRGLAAARNTGVSAAKGDFIMHLDSDDWLEADALQVLVKKQIDTDADIVSGDAIAEYDNHRELLTEPKYADKNEMMRHMIELSIDHVIWRRIIRRSLYLDYDIMAIEGLNIGEDHYTIPKLIYYAKKCEHVNRVVHHYNCRNENSYMYGQTLEQQIKRYYSNVRSINVLLDFFAGKDRVCVEKLNEIKVWYVYRFSNVCFDRCDGENYNKCMKELYAMGNTYTDIVGIKGVVRRLLYADFNRFRLYLKLRGVKVPQRML